MTQGAPLLNKDLNQGLPCPSLAQWPLQYYRLSVSYFPSSSGIYMGNGGSKTRLYGASLGMCVTLCTLPSQVHLLGRRGRLPWYILGSQSFSTCKRKFRHLFWGEGWGENGCCGWGGGTTTQRRNGSYLSPTRDKSAIFFQL